MVYRIALRGRTGQVVAWSMVDHVDVRLTRVRWYLNGKGYVCRETRERGRRRKVYLHREVAGLVFGDGKEVDHLNGDPLDNRRENLRVVTHAQNTQNRIAGKGSTSRFRGVSWDKENQRWRASVRVDGRLRYLGLFIDELEAAGVASAYREKHLPFTVEARA